ncbi:TPA: glycosyltransferase [Vibrio vulnificus]
MHFLFHTASLTASGGSRVICNLASYLCEKGHQVTIIIDRNRVAFPIHPDVKILFLTTCKIIDITPKEKGDTRAYKKHIDKKSKKKKKLKLRHKYKLVESVNEWKKYLLKLITFPSKSILIKKKIKEIKPDLVVSHNMYYFLEHYLFYNGTNFCITLHNSPNQVFIDRTVKSIFPISFFFNNRNCISVSKGVEKEMRALFPNSINQTIYNPLDVTEINKLSLEEIPNFFKDNKYIVTVSSLAPGKRIDRSIIALSKLKNKEIKLVIIGDGEEKKHLEQLSMSLNLENRVIFTGFIENPLPYMKNAEMLSFTSDYEGFGLVIIEALACKTPVISTNCPSGPSEILTDNLAEFLVDIKNVDEAKITDDISLAMEKIISSPPKITYEHVKRFDKKEITLQWENLAIKNNSK